MKNVSKVTTAELTAILTALPNGIGSIAQINQYTTPKCLKNVRDAKQWCEIKKKDVKVPFTDEIRKASDVSVIVATDYERNVVNELNREGLDESEYKKGKNTMPINFEESENTFAGTFNGLGVVQYRPNPNEKMKVVPNYYLNKVQIDKANLPDVLPKVYAPKNQGTKKAILWRKLYIANIKQITIKGNVYENIECAI